MDERECSIYSRSVDHCQPVENLLLTADINECAEIILGCGPCRNFVGGHWCNCVKGFTPDEAEHECLNIDECLDDPCNETGEVTVASISTIVPG